MLRRGAVAATSGLPHTQRAGISTTSRTLRPSCAERTRTSCSVGVRVSTVTPKPPGGACLQLFNGVFGAHNPKFLERGVASSTCAGCLHVQGCCRQLGLVLLERFQTLVVQASSGGVLRIRRSTVRLRRVLGNAGDHVGGVAGVHIVEGGYVPAGEHSCRHSTRSAPPSAGRSPAAAEKYAC